MGNGVAFGTGIVALNKADPGVTVVVVVQGISVDYTVTPPILHVSAIERGIVQVGGKALNVKLNDGKQLQRQVPLPALDTAQTQVGALKVSGLQIMDLVRDLVSQVLVPPPAPAT